MTCSAVVRDAEFVARHEDVALLVGRRAGRRDLRDDYTQEARIGLLEAAREPSVDGVPDVVRAHRKARRRTVRLWLKCTPGMTTPARFGGRARPRPHKVDGGLGVGGPDAADVRSSDGVRVVDDRDECRAALTALSGRQRIIVELYFGLGRPAQDTPRIAATLGIARSTVVDDIHAALDKMRRRLERGA